MRRIEQGGRGGVERVLDADEPYVFLGIVALAAGVIGTWLYLANPVGVEPAPAPPTEAPACCPCQGARGAATP